MEDPVQEKLNQLKRIASERKAAHQSKTKELNQDEQDKFVKFVRSKLNSFITNGRVSPEPVENDQRKLQQEKQNKFKLQYQKSVELSQKEKDESLLQERSAKLQKELEEAGVVCEDNNNDQDKPEPNKTRRTSTENSLLNKDGFVSSSIELNEESQSSMKDTSSSEKKPIKGILIQSQPLDNSTAASNRYVNRIKSLYDKERSCSQELTLNSKNPNRFLQQRSRTQDLSEAPVTSQSIEIPSEQVRKSKAEFLESMSNQETDGPSASQMASESKPKPPRTFVQSRLEAFNPSNNSLDNQEKNDVVRLMEQNLLVHNGYNQIVDTLREKFDDKSQSQARIKSSRSPSLIPTEHVK